MFFLGLLITGLAGIVGSHMRSNYSREGSLLSTILAPEAHADTTGYITYGDSGGCSSGDSADSCGGSDGSDSDSGSDGSGGGGDA